MQTIFDATAKFCQRARVTAEAAASIMSRCLRNPIEYSILDNTYNSMYIESFIENFLRGVLYFRNIYA